MGCYIIRGSRLGLGCCGPLFLNMMGDQGAPPRSLWNLQGSAVPCGLKEVQGSAQLHEAAGQKGQMVEEEEPEGERWVEGAREHENQQGREE